MERLLPLQFYKGHNMAPFARQYPDGICPFCKLNANKLTSLAFTIHMRKCFVKGLLTAEEFIINTNTSPDVYNCAYSGSRLV